METERGKNEMISLALPHIFVPSMVRSLKVTHSLPPD
jgi:hypothetical protein